MHQHMLRTAAALATGVVLTLAACGGGDDDSGPPTSDTPSAETPAPETALPDEPSDSTITISGFAFGGVTEVAVGTTVVVTNEDSATHTWSAVDGPFESGAIAPGESFEFTFTEAGTFDYFCNFHPSMAGTITVTG